MIPTELGLATAPLAVSGAVAAAACGWSLDFRHRVDHRARMRSVMREVAHLVDEHAERRPVRRHSVHCSCGRFARLVTAGPRGRWVRCAAHGLRWVSVRRVGVPEVHRVRMVLHAPLVEPDPVSRTPELRR